MSRLLFSIAGGFCFATPLNLPQAGRGGVVAERDPIFLRTRLRRKANLVLAALRLSDSVAKLHHAEAPFPIPADTEIITRVV